MNWIVENWEIIAGIVSLFIGTPAAYFIGKRKKAAETDIVRGDAISRMQKAYDGFVEDQGKLYLAMKEDYKSLQEECRLIRKENYQEREEIRTLRKSHEKTLQENERLKKYIADWERKYKNLKQQFERLKKKYEEKTNNTSSDGN